MKTRSKLLLIGWAMLLSLCVRQADAALVNWTVDSANSYVRINLPLNSTVSISGTAVTIRLRNADNSAWSDAGGRMSRFSGTLATEYSEDTFGPGSPNHIQYLDGSHALQSINFGSFRPDPDQFSPTATNASNPQGQYTDTGGSPHSFAIRFNLQSLLLVNLPPVYYGLRDIQYSAGSGLIALVGSGGNYTAGANASTFGWSDGLVDIDAPNMGVLLGQLIPDSSGGSLASWFSTNLETNSGGLTITNLGGLSRQLDQNIDIPVYFAAYDFGTSQTSDDWILAGRLQGRLRAFATVPEPTSGVLVGIAAASSLLRRRRKKRQYE
ncbi:MAG: PEP-CTERM sorting domain-containing protein [Pirellulaceae bacterium]|nr:PEP-CTERM sorting domain-containing protein [Pirellulaceae bacterium]